MKKKYYNLTWREIFKPTIVKIILLIILMLISLTFLSPQVMDVPSYWGWPFPIRVKGCNFWGGGCVDEFFLHGLILDIIFWYFIACIIVVAYHVNTKQVKRIR